MIAATLAATEFLPTNTSAMDFPLIYVGFAVAALVLIGAVLWFRFYDDEPTYIFIGLIIAFMAGGMPALALIDTANETNRDNLTENIKTVYDIENVMFEDTTIVVDDKITNASPLTITVTKDGKAYNVILNQDKKTFEPNLSSFETDSIDIETLKRDKR
jgi:hypothetical protein